MTVENTVKMIAGIFIFLSALAGYFININFLFFTMFVGLNLFQYSFTGWCPMALILKKAGLES